VFALAECGEVFFKFLDKRAAGKRAGVENFLNGVIYFVLD
jgi:hypothetical protein